VIARDPRTGIAWVEGDDAASIERAVELLRHDQPAAPATLELVPVDGDGLHRARVETLLDRIGRGELYQACVARSFASRTDAPATALLDAMLARTDARFASALDFGDHAVISSSPELFLDVRGRRVLTSPIKGTRPRGLDAEEDRARIAELANDPKEEAELVMVVDLERNDLGRVAEIGSVRVVGPARIETSRTVHHRVRDVTARTDARLGAIFRAMFPSGSVTGAPKIRAMETIAELERDRRGIYCGAILAIDRAGGARAAMAIRTLVVDRASGRAEYLAGGGIVAGSVPEREVEETRWKSRQVMAR
jgi:anthranilate/para-aminobenzoate synthase component I